MAAQHWSKDMYSLWWRDRGTGRKRVSFAPEKASLVARYDRVWHADVDAALYAPDGSRVPLALPADAAPAKAKKKAKKRAPKNVAEAVAEPVGA